MKYGCIGEHLKHSFSKEIHNALADYEYEIKEIPRDELDDFMIKKDFIAINVTIPYKELVMPHLYFIDEHAKEIGSVNTILNENGKLYGYNTDFYGMSKLIEHAGIDIKEKKVAILGTGGTAKTATAVSKALGAKEILIASRCEKDDYISYQRLYNEHSDIEVIINTTPLGMYPNIHAAAVDVKRFPRLEGVIDAVYNPLRTELVLEAEKQKIPAEGGLYMLVSQGVRAAEIFLGKECPQDAESSVFNILRQQKQNIVLIGMPSSGKSTVGKILSNRLGCEFIDTDTIIEEKTGMKISDYIDKNGIEKFREIEEKAVEELCFKNGCVIATGGGVILRESNMMALKPNGRVYFINRPPSALTPTSDRPLSRTKEAIAEQFAERYGIYKYWADREIDANCDAQAVADKILEDFKR